MFEFKPWRSDGVYQDFPMIDRKVRRIIPIDKDDQSRPFSEYVQSRNIVLLGDPGAGKSHLFRSAAELEGGELLSVRSFLNVPIALNAIVFADALDEKRAGRGDDDTVDQIVRRLFAAPPAKFRLSCRDRDWLGDSDVTAFKPYFDENGGLVVLSLQ